MVADDVEVAVVDERLVAGVEDELDVVHLRLHEHVDHGEVDVSRVGERHLTNMEGLPRNRNKMGKILLHIKNFHHTWLMQGCRSLHSCPQQDQSRRWQCCSSSR